jgi:hypothetical protein
MDDRFARTKDEKACASRKACPGPRSGAQSSPREDICFFTCWDLQQMKKQIFAFFLVFFVHFVVQPVSRLSFSAPLREIKPLPDLAVSNQSIHGTGTLFRAIIDGDPALIKDLFHHIVIQTDKSKADHRLFVFLRQR